MRTFVHLLLFACGIAVGLGALLPLLGNVQLSDVSLTALREGFPTQPTLDQLAVVDAPIVRSATMPTLVAAALILLGGLTGARTIAWLGVLTGLATLGLTLWRLAGPLTDLIRTSSPDQIQPWGIGLVGGGLLLALLALLTPRERRRPLARSR